MRVNERGGYDVLLRNKGGRYLAGNDIDDPIWVSDQDAARAEDTDVSMRTVAMMYGFADENGKFEDGYELERIPWVNPDLELDDRFYDEENDIFNFDAIKEYVFGEGDIAPSPVVSYTLGKRE